MPSKQTKSAPAVAAPLTQPHLPTLSEMEVERDKLMARRLAGQDAQAGAGMSSSAYLESLGDAGDQPATAPLDDTWRAAIEGGFQKAAGTAQRVAGTAVKLSPRLARFVAGGLLRPATDGTAPALQQQPSPVLNWLDEQVLKGDEYAAQLDESAAERERIGEYIQSDSGWGKNLLADIVTDPLVWATLPVGAGLPARAAAAGAKAVGASKVGQALARAVGENIAQGVVMSAAQRKPITGAQLAGSALIGIVPTAVGEAAKAGARGVVNKVGKSAQEIFEKAVHTNEGGGNYVNVARYPGSSTPSINMGRMQFSANAGHGAWTALQRAGAMTPDELAQFRAGNPSKELIQRTNRWLAAHPQFLAGQERAQAEMLWNHARKVLADNGQADAPPEVVANLADIFNEWGTAAKGFGENNSRFRDAQGKITTESVQTWRATHAPGGAKSLPGHIARGEKIVKAYAAEAPTGWKQRVDPRQYVSQDLAKGTLTSRKPRVPEGSTAADIDALVKGRGVDTRTPAVSPEAARVGGDDLAKNIEAINKRIEELSTTNPDAAGLAMAERDTLIREAEQRAAAAPTAAEAEFRAEPTPVTRTTAEPTAAPAEQADVASALDLSRASDVSDAGNTLEAIAQREQQLVQFYTNRMEGLRQIYEQARGRGDTATADAIRREVQALEESTRGALLGIARRRAAIEAEDELAARVAERQASLRERLPDVQRAKARARVEGAARSGEATAMGEAPEVAPSASNFDDPEHEAAWAEYAQRVGEDRAAAERAAIMAERPGQVRGGVRQGAAGEVPGGVQATPGATQLSERAMALIEQDITLPDGRTVRFASPEDELLAHYALHSRSDYTRGVADSVADELTTLLGFPGDTARLAEEARRIVAEIRSMVARAPEGADLYVPERADYGAMVRPTGEGRGLISEGAAAGDLGPQAVGVPHRVTVLGATHDFADFVQTPDFAFLTNIDDFLEPLILRAVGTVDNRYDDIMDRLQPLADNARTSAANFDTYIRAVEDALGPQYSLTLPPEEFAGSQALARAILDSMDDIASTHGITAPLTSYEPFLRALTRYWANDPTLRSFGPDELDAFTTALGNYTRAFRDGTLTAAEHSTAMQTFARILTGMRATIDRGAEGVNSYNPLTGAISLRADAQLADVMHEVMHAASLNSPAVARKMANAVGELTSAERLAVARQAGAHITDADYAVSTEETAASLLHVLFTAPETLSTNARRAATAIAGSMRYADNLRVAAIAQALQASARLSSMPNASRYRFLQRAAQTLTEARLSQGAMLRAVSADGERVTNLFIDGTPLDARVYDTVAGVLEDMGALEAGTVQRQLTPLLSATDSSLYSGWASDSMTASGRAHIARQIGDSLKTGLGVAKSIAASRGGRLLPLKWRAEALNADGSLKNPHLHAAWELATKFARESQAKMSNYFDGPDGILAQPWMKLHAGEEGWSGLLKAVRDGKHKTLSDADNAAVGVLMRDSIEKGAWPTDEIVDAADMSANAKAMMKYMIPRVRERSQALHQSAVEFAVGEHPELAQQFGGKGMSAKEIIDEAAQAGTELPAELRATLRAIDDTFKPGYFPTQRLGPWRIAAVDETGQAVHYEGFFSKREATARAKELAAGFRDNPDTADWVVREPQFTDIHTPAQQSIKPTRKLAGNTLRELHKLEMGTDMGVDDLADALSAAQYASAGPGFLRKRRGVPGWESQDHVLAMTEFIRRSSLYEQGQNFRYGMAGLADNPAVRAAGKDGLRDLNYVFNNTLGLAGDFERMITKTVPHARSVIGQLQKAGRAMTLGFSNPRKVELDVAHHLSVTIPEVFSILEAAGQKWSSVHGTRYAIAGLKDGAAIVGGFAKDVDQDVVAALNEAVKAGYFKSDMLTEQSLKKFINKGTLRTGYTKTDALTQISSVMDAIGRGSGEAREISAFSTMYRALRDAMPGVDRSTLIAKAGQVVQETLNLNPANRPTTPLMSGMVGSALTSFKMFLLNLAEKTATNVKLAGGHFVSMPNPAWKPGMPDSAKLIPVPVKTIKPLMAQLAASAALGGTIGIPGVGYLVGMYNYFADDDATLRASEALKAKIGGRAGRLVGALVDHGLMAEYAGVDLSESGSLVLPKLGEGIEQLSPIALEIIADRARALYNGAADPKPDSSRAMQMLRAVSPGTVQHFEDVATTMANDDRVFKANGQLIGYVNTPELVKMALNGMAVTKSDLHRREMLSTNALKRLSKDRSDQALRIAQAIENNSTLSKQDYAAWYDKGTQRRVKTILRDRKLPASVRFAQKAVTGRDAVLDDLRRELYNDYWRSAYEDDAESMDQGDDLD